MGFVNSASDLQKMLDMQKYWTWPLSKYTLNCDVK